MKYIKPNYFFIYIKKFFLMIFVFPFMWIILTIYVFFRLLFTLDTLRIEFIDYIESGEWDFEDDK